MAAALRKLTLIAILIAVPVLARAEPHNVILFVPDGLRALMVTPETAPAMAAVRDAGVDFKNPHSLFPTFTTANASAMATGHYLGDTGDFSNTIYTGFAVPSAGGSPLPFIENDLILGDIDEHFSGDYLNQATLLKAAREAGFSTAAVGKLGPVLIFDHTNRTGAPTIVIDDATGTPKGIPLSPEMQAALAAAGLPTATPPRGDNGKPGTRVANLVQQAYFADVATKVLLPMFRARGKPFVLVYWSRDPDGTQHAQGDSLNELTPGINGPTSLAAIRNADDNLARLRHALDDLGLAATTDIFVSADHGFSTISKQSETSPATRARYADVPAGQLPPGFVAIDLATALGLTLFDPDEKNAIVESGKHGRFGHGLIGRDSKDPDLAIAANGGSDLIYFPKKNPKLVEQVVAALMAQDYVSGLFVDDSLGRFAGTLPLSAINLRGTAITPQPAIVVNFRSSATGCAQPVTCAVAVADTALRQGQGMHGSFSRADTMNFMAAIGPSFKAGFVVEAPASNADVGKTLARILGLKIKDTGKLVGRVLGEAMPGGATPPYVARVLRSPAAADGLATVLEYQRVGNTRYFTVAGFPGRTVGLGAAKPAAQGGAAAVR